jgi:predicted DNA-binding transcriptional regulator AlpA
MPRNDALSYDDIAELTGVSTSTLRGYRAKGQMPQPDASPHPRVPMWRRRTIEEWLANRPGRGAPGQPRISRRRS